LLRPRVLIYGTLILGLAVAFVVSLTLRNPLRVDVIRDRGVLGREVAGGMIENVYRLQIINTSDSPLRLRLSADGRPGRAGRAGQGEWEGVDGAAAANKLGPMVIRAPAGAEPGAHPITLRARARDQENRSIETDEPASFYVPE
ncbi:FixG Ig-like domain-containing protein, partial [Achromobacter xylosoxidans]|uniref:FixG Ig-like domain-containing protein n=1 Tax=Alcaligenes xylosoxydans xylosoxydans TaxID=85698 RepID=UPI003F6273C5